MDLAPKEVTDGLLEGISTFVLQWTFKPFATRCCFDLLYLSLSVDNASLCHRKEKSLHDENTFDPDRRTSLYRLTFKII